MIRTAVLSPCGRYRYLLGRIWNELAIPLGPRIVLWVMLNPSTANDDVDDPTIRRCINISDSLGYDGLEVVNLFAWRSPTPLALAKADDPVGPENDLHIKEAVARASRIVVAWGNGIPMADQRRSEVRKLLRPYDLHCLGHTGVGAPRHPLYVRREQELELFAVEGA